MGKETRELGPTYIHSVPCWRAQIINGVLTDGLQSAQTLLSRGITLLDSLSDITRLGNKVEGRVLFPPGQPKPVVYTYHRDHTASIYRGDYFENLPRALYKNQFSVLPVITEKRTDPYSFMRYINADEPSEKATALNWIEENREILAKRLASSFLVVCLFDESFIQLALHTNGKEQVEPSSFIFLIFPSIILSEYYDLAENRKRQIPIPIKVVPGTVRRKLAGIPEPFAVPNYEFVLKQILQETGAPVWVHGVRLPTQEDLQ